MTNGPSYYLDWVIDVQNRRWSVVGSRLELRRYKWGLSVNKDHINLAKGGIDDRCCHLVNHKSFFRVFAGVRDPI